MFFLAETSVHKCYPIMLILFILCLALRCDKADQIDHYIFIHNFSEKTTINLFANGLQAVADSLSMTFSLFHHLQAPPRDILDSLINIADGMGCAIPVQQEHIADFFAQAGKKDIPVVQFDHPYNMAASAVLVDTDYYTAGRTAAHHLLQRWGDNGRFGIVTATLQDRNSNECIRGFRELLSQKKSNWKQINIITCGDQPDQALQQYRHATRFGNRIIWFFIHDYDEFLNQLKNLKKDNFFIAIDLHPKENNIKFLVDGYLDALVSKDFATMGKQCFLELVRQNRVNSESDRIAVNCGGMVLTSCSVTAITQ